MGSSPVLFPGLLGFHWRAPGCLSQKPRPSRDESQPRSLLIEVWRGVLARGESGSGSGGPQSGSGSGGPRLEPMFHTKPVGRAPRSRHLNRQKLARFFTCTRAVRCCARATCQEYAWLCSIVRRRRCHSIKTRCVTGGWHTQPLFGGVSVIRQKFAARSHLRSETPVSTRLSVEKPALARPFARHVTGFRRGVSQYRTSDRWVCVQLERKNVLEFHRLA